ncbi:caspase-3-like [Amphiura filiformis]|uniref:caspase-3-like n=1 Tax=Amphiura filiformis TaxID=82378 RepID=UPI003B21268C
MEQGDSSQNTNVNNGNYGGLMSQPPAVRYEAPSGSTLNPPSSGPPAMSTHPRQLRDQHDASPFIPPLPIYEKGRGYLLFINNFVRAGGVKKRDGAMKDEDNIRMAFEDYVQTFTINIQSDLSKRALLLQLDSVAGELERNDFKSFMCIICSHGERHAVESNGQQAFKEGFLTMDEQLVTEDEVTEKFEGHKLQRLRGCPKVFIFQCCRGTAYGRGTLDKADSTEVEPTSYSAAARIDMSDGPKPVNLPRNADMLVVHSTSKGTKAWRNQVDGSWFIKSFCETLKTCHKTDHLLDMLLRVNSEVADRESTEGGAKQMPCQVSTFTKKFMLGL